MTQQKKVLTWLRKHKTITPREALMDLGVYRLSDVILKLRKTGMNILTEMRENDNTGAKYATYKLVTARH